MPRALWSLPLLCTLIAPAAAAERVPLGDAAALQRLAVRFEHGEGFAQDYARARALYCMAALENDPRAAFGLGWMYANGRGVPVDDGVAAGWLHHAVALGDEAADDALQLLGGPPPATDRHCRVAGSGWEQHQARITALVQVLAPEFGLNPELVVALVRVESNFNLRAVSPKGAKGLMQLMPGTATRFGVRDVWDPVDNLSGGMAYLSWLIDFYGGDLVRALAGYNAGEQAVERYGGVPPFAETEAYVARITSDLGVATHAAGLAASPLHAVFIPEPVREAYLRASSTLSSSCCQVARLPPS